MGSLHPHSADEEIEAQREAGTYSGRPNLPGLELELTSFVSLSLHCPPLLALVMGPFWSCGEEARGLCLAQIPQFGTPSAKWRHLFPAVLDNARKTKGNTP